MRRTLILVLLVCIGALAGGSSSGAKSTAAPTVVYAGTFANCNGATPRRLTIQDAVNLVADNGTVKVCKGTFDESVTVSHPVKIVGVTRPGLASSCNATTAASPSRDSIVEPSAGDFAFDIESDNVTLSGLVITNPTPDKWGVVVNLSPPNQQSGAYSGLTVTKNVFEHMASGTTALFLSSNGTNPTLVQSNCFRLNAEDGIFAGWGNNDPNSNVTIQANKFLNDAYGDIILAASTQDDITVSGNISTGGGYFFRANTLSTFTVSANIAKNHDTSSTSKRAVIFIGGSSTDGTISGNILQNGTDRGLVFDQVDTGTRNSSIKVQHNIITGFGDNPIEVEDSSLDDSTFSGNIAKTTTGDSAVFVGFDNNDNTFTGNIFMGLNWGCNDASIGGGTSGTANTWGDSNIGKPHNSPIDICFPHK